MLKKKVNGKEVICSEIEEAAFRAEWAKNAELKVIEIAEEERKIKLREQARGKILDAFDLSAEEKSLIFT